ncbi:restriction endonuclease [Brachyspira aalborgi]|uniref:Restriction endonuclease n=1 Tax=Brachyspira aalborgi TaxID=29522 RepID=A0A5C8EEV4_9SPIR|nr:restriction endonuclease [Brachyspira aalborgi]TXJ20928.1 restriction endonuclease [Brachyspira aalborgi]TXJ36305.1 restriction endonuclease [Brachyspira aalborgi]TXJ58742.1 restriction endonuclease [Brachyspira aalborgi]
MEDIFIYLAVSVFLIISSSIILKNIFYRDGKKNSKDIKKTIEELYKKIEENPEDYRAIYDLAKCEEEIGKIELALEKYELLANNGILEKREELNICKKLESKYSELGKKEEAFKYAIKIIKIEPSNNLYIIKVANTLAKEGNFKLSNHYFGKAIVSKAEFMTEDLKCAAFVSYKMKDYKKCIAFLEELRKRLIKEAIANKSKDIKKDILELEKDLISTYILSEELNIAKSFIEDILSNKFIDKNHEFDINKLYLFVLYKLEESERFKSLYNKLYSLYKINESNKNYAHLKFDYSFYSYFLGDIEMSKNYFELIKSFDMPEFNIYNLDEILNYLNAVIKATTVLNKLKEENKLGEEKYKNDNYENYVGKENIENWEKTVNSWEISFINFDYIMNLIEVQKTMDIDNILESLKIAEKGNPNNNITIAYKVDKIFSLDRMSFKKLCGNIMKSKFSDYVIVQEYTDATHPANSGEEINYLTYNIKGSKKELILISFKRWQKSEIGELMVRDFLMMVSESGAKSGVLIAPVELSNSAKSYVSHNEKIRVYTRSQFNNLLKDEKI